MKENLIFIIRSSAGEVEWIMPFWFFLKEREKDFIIIFESQKSFKSLELNEELYTLWNDNFSQQSYFPYLNSTLYKIMDNLSDVVIFKNSRYRITFEKLLSFLSINAHFRSTYTFLINRFNSSKGFFLFKDYNGASSLSQYLEKRLKNSDTIFFPHSNHIFSDSNSSSNSNVSINPRHHLILSNQTDQKIFKNNLSLNSIATVGFTFTDEYWTNRVLEDVSGNEMEVEDEAFNILLISRAIHPIYLSRKDKMDYLEWILEACSKFKQVNLFIKQHPREVEENLNLNEIIRKYDQVKVHIAQKSLMKLCSNMDLVISFWTSGILQAKFHGKPVIELYEPKQRDLDCAYDNEGKVTTIYRKLGLVEGTSNKDDFMLLFSKGLNSPEDKIWIKQNENFNIIEGVKEGSCILIFNFLKEISERKSFKSMD